MCLFVCVCFFLTQNIDELFFFVLQNSQLDLNFTLDDITIDLTSPHFITKVANPVAVSITSLYYRIYAIFVMHKKLPEIIENLQKIDAILHLPEIHQKNDFKRLIYYIVIIVAILPLQLYAIWFVCGGINNYMAFFLIGLTNNYAVECTEFLFISLCYLIQSRFTFISKKLIQQKTPNNYCLKSICQTVDTFTFKEITPQKHSDDLLIANEIQTLRVAFQKLIKISEMLNTHYSIRLLFSLGVCAFNVLTNLYMGMFGGYATNFLLQSFEASLWACYYFSRFVWLCVACDFLCEQVGNFFKKL